MIVIEAPLSYVSTFAYRGEFMIWFGFISRLFQWGGGHILLVQIIFYLSSLCLEEGGGGVSTL
jgi:hypothetical protein